MTRREIPGARESMLRGLPRPVDYNPYSAIARELEECTDLVRRDVERLDPDGTRRARRAIAVLYMYGIRTVPT